MANANSASGSADFSGRYLQARHGCDLRSIPYFGVRVKSDLWLIIASSTARALLSERPIPTASKHGRKRSSLIQVAGCSSRAAQMQKRPTDADAARKNGLSTSTVRTQPTGGPPVEGYKRTQRIASSRYAKFDIKCPVASSFIRKGSWLRQTLGNNFLHVWTEPFVQRCCSELKP